MTDRDAEVFEFPGLGRLDLLRLVRDGSDSPLPKPQPVCWPGGYGQADPHENGKRVILLAHGQTTKWQAPVNDRSYDVWGLTDGWVHYPRFTRWFEPHLRECVLKHSPPEYLTFLQTCNVPVMTRYPFPEIPTAQLLPLDHMKAVFGDYFESSIAYMVGLAILEGYQDIHLYGVDLHRNTPYEAERNSTEYLIGWARGSGIRVHIPSGSRLLKPERGLYGDLCEHTNPAKRFAFLRRLAAKHTARRIHMEEEQQHASTEETGSSSHSDACGSETKKGLCPSPKW